MASKPAPLNPTIRRVAPGVFEIEGRSGVYAVRRGLGCSCTAASFGRACWHVGAVKAWALANPEKPAQVVFLERFGLAA
jgi:hypothetical protein